MFALLFAIYFYGQDGEVKGSVVDKHGPLPGASIRLMQTELDKEIKGDISDFDGNYDISADLNKRYYLEISHMGYQNIWILLIYLQNKKSKS